MPLTLAHPAAVLPLRKWAPLFGGFSSLVIGSVAPDITYFVPFGIHRAATHSLIGGFAIALPLGVACWILYHINLRPVLTPPDAAEPPPASRDNPITLSILCRVSLGVFLGLLLHLGWDAFTHRTGYMVLQHQFLRTHVAFIPGRAIPLYKVLQHLSTVTGILAILICTRANLSTFAHFAVSSRQVQHRLVLISAAAVSSAAMHFAFAVILHASVPQILGCAFVGGVRGALAAFLYIAISHRIRPKQVPANAIH